MAKLTILKAIYLSCTTSELHEIFIGNSPMTSQYGILWSVSGYLTSSEIMSMGKTMKIQKLAKMSLSLASNSDVDGILVMTQTSWTSGL